MGADRGRRRRHLAPLADDGRDVRHRAPCTDMGKLLLVNDVGWFSELPDDVALKVAPNDGEVERLALAMETLCDRAVRERMGANAQELASEEHDVERVAELYASALREAADSEGVVRALDEAQL
jgi:hypothetical protein